MLTVMIMVMVTYAYTYAYAYVYADAVEFNTTIQLSDSSTRRSQDAGLRGSLGMSQLRQVSPCISSAGIRNCF